MDWSSSGWDVTRDGQLQSCVYDSQDYDNYACSDFASFTSSDSEGAPCTGTCSVLKDPNEDDLLGITSANHVCTGK